MSANPPPSSSMPPGGGSYTPPPPPPAGGPAMGSDRTIFLILSYLGILSLIPLLVKKDDPEVQWHAKNGVALFGAECIWAIAQIAIGFTHIAILGCVSGLVGCLVWIAFLALSVICIVKAVGGQRFRIPMITDMAEKM